MTSKFVRIFNISALCALFFLKCFAVADAQTTSQSALDEVRAADIAAEGKGKAGSNEFNLARRPKLIQLLHTIEMNAPTPVIRPAPSVNSDPRFRRNLVAMLKSTINGIKPRIFGGTAVPSGLYQDTVAVIGDGSFCTGTLIGSNVVLTAGHCVCGQNISVVFFGTDANNLHTGTSVPVSKVLSRTDCPLIANAKYIDPGNDFGLIWLRYNGPATPRAIASIALLAKMHDVTAVGFGYTETGQAYRKMEADIPIASAQCAGVIHSQPDEKYYGCVKERELVAATLSGKEKDTCIGDSGGPIFLNTGSKDDLLVGITSRGVSSPGAAECGDGGIYELVGNDIVQWLTNNGVNANIIH